jgi:hypothetical protein
MQYIIVVLGGDLRTLTSYCICYSSSSSSSYGCTAQFGPLASPFWDFVTITFLQGWVVSPTPNPQPGGPGLRIYDPRRQGGPAIPPEHWVPMLVAFYDMHGLQWDCSLIPATTRDVIRIIMSIQSAFAFINPLKPSGNYITTCFNNQ